MEPVAYSKLCDARASQTRALVRAARTPGTIREQPREENSPDDPRARVGVIVLLVAVASVGAMLDRRMNEQPDNR